MEKFHDKTGAGKKLTDYENGLAMWYKLRSCSDPTISAIILGEELLVCHLIALALSGGDEKRFSAENLFSISYKCLHTLNQPYYD